MGKYNFKWSILKSIVIVIFSFKQIIYYLPLSTCPYIRLYLIQCYRILQFGPCYGSVHTLRQNLHSLCSCHKVVPSIFSN